MAAISNATICGAHSRTTGKPCQNIAGKGTDHVGEGRCRYHGGATPTKHGLYSKVRRARLGARIAEMAKREDLLNLNEEVAILKLSLQQLLGTNEGIIEALRNWHQVTAPAFEVLRDKSIQDGAAIGKAVHDLRQAEETRPEALPDIKATAMIVDKIGRTVERVYKIEALCTREEAERLLERAGNIVAKYVDEETIETIRKNFLDLKVGDPR